MKGDIGIDFATLRRSSSPNDYLVCAPGRSPAPSDEEGTRYAVSPGTVFALAREALPREPRTVVVRDQPEVLRMALVQRSRPFRFPDVVTLQVFVLPEGGSELAICSRSVYGRSDLGVNRRRVQRWIGLIASQL